MTFPGTADVKRLYGPQDRRAVNPSREGKNRGRKEGFVEPRTARFAKPHRSGRCMERSPDGVRTIQPRKEDRSPQGTEQIMLLLTRT